MSEPLQRNLIHRMRYTPMRDLIRGRLTGRLDFKRQIEAADLLPEAKALLLRVVHRTRVWSLERTEIADELISHFVNGLAAGQTAERLIGAFGDERTAARLLSRAKKRTRPISMQAISGLRWLALALLVYYVGLTGYFYAGKPSLKVNYLELLNRPTQEASLDQRAWPLYRNAFLAFNPIEVDGGVQVAKPGDAEWPQKADWLRQHSDALDLIRQASEKLSFGFIFGPGGSANDQAIWPGPYSAHKRFDEGSLVKIRLPFGEARFVAWMLADDAKLARLENDESRSLRNSIALTKFAEHLRQCNTIVSELLSLSIRHMAMDEIQAMLTQTPGQLTEIDLQQLAHQLAKPDTTGELASLSGSVMAFQDILQHAYTDDGHGDGRLTAEGMRLLHAMMDPNQQLRPSYLAIWPASLIVSSSRRTMQEQFDRRMIVAQQKLSQPRRTVSWRSEQEEQMRWQYTGLNYLRDWPVGVFGASFSKLHSLAELYLGRRDGILVGIALELYKRQRGEYPASLDSLTPLLLPSVPVDRITGGPLHYRLVDGQPIVYSVGADRDDDGGRYPLAPGGNLDWFWFSVATWDIAPDKAVDGDWVLYPEPPSQNFW